MTSPSSRTRPALAAREITPGVVAIGPWGLTRTVVYLVRSDDRWALVDAGWAGDGDRIAAAVDSVLGPGTVPSAILLTHAHPDHEGDALALARRWRCPVLLGPGELPIAARDLGAMHASAPPLDRWVVLPIIRMLGRRRREALFAKASLAEVARGLVPDAPVPGFPDWVTISTPGHTAGHVSFFRPTDRVLLSGDALVTTRIDTLRHLLLRRPGLSGPPWYTTWSRRSMHASVQAVAALRPTVLGGGHGDPLVGTGTAQAVAAFADAMTAR